MNLKFSARSIQENGCASGPAMEEAGYTDLAGYGLQMNSSCVEGDGSLEHPYLLELTLSNPSGSAFRGIVQTELLCTGSGPSSSPEFFLPGFLYGTNRGDTPIRVDNRYPRIRPGKPALPASSWWMTRSDRLSHPAAFLYLPGKEGENAIPDICTASAQVLTL